MNCSSLMHLQICVAAPEQHAAAQACRAVACALSTVGSELDLRMRGTVETKFAVAPLHLTINAHYMLSVCLSLFFNR